MDDFSCLPMTAKSTVRKIIIDFITTIENQFSTVVKSIRI